MPPYIKIIQEKAFNFLILLPEKEDVKKKMEKETAIDTKKKGIALLCFLRRVMFRDVCFRIFERIFGQSKQIGYRHLNLSMYRWQRKNYTRQSYTGKEDFIQSYCNKGKRPNLMLNSISLTQKTGEFLRAEMGWGHRRPSAFANWLCSK